MKRKKKDHLVVNALLRIENVTESPPPPFEMPRAGMDFWVLELSSFTPEELTGWQARVLPILRRYMPMLKKWQKAGTRCFLHVQTESPMPMFPAVFQPIMLATLSKIYCTLEHGVDTEPENQKRSRARRSSVRR